MQETASCAHKDLRGVGEPICFEERQYLCIQQCVARIEAVVSTVFAREFDTGQHNFRLFFHNGVYVLL